jgi:hypothetical protein
MPNIGQGFTRIWIVLVAGAELLVLGLLGFVVWNWVTENVFDQFDEGYLGIWWRISPFVALLIAIPVTGWGIWAVARWIVRGFLVERKQVN